MTELKPCPFCGSSSVCMDRKAGPHPYPRVMCAGCGSIFSMGWTTTCQNVEDAWNRREGERRARDEGFREAMARYST